MRHPMESRNVRSNPDYVIHTINNSNDMHQTSISLTLDDDDAQKSAARKRVHFSKLARMYDAVHPLDPGLWYRRNDIKAFRDQARDLCDRMIQCMNNGEDEKNTTATATASSSAAIQAIPRLPCLSLDSYSRGLEQTICYERRRRKYLANRLIVKLARRQRNNNNNNKVSATKLAQVAHRCTRWATKIAVKEAARDYSRAWRVTTTERSSSSTDEGWTADGCSCYFGKDDKK